MLLPEVVWNSVLSVATEDRLFVCATRFSTRPFCSVSLCGLPLCDEAVVAPRRFHFTITALTVDPGSSIRAEMWLTDLLERWHPLTVPRWKWLSSSVSPFYCQCLSMEFAWLCAWLYTLPSKSLGSLRNVLFLKEKHFFLSIKITSNWSEIQCRHC